MKKKSKGETIELLYTSPKEKKKQIKNKNIKAKKKNVGSTSNNQKSNKTINLNNEIIIGLTPKKEVQNKKIEQTKKKTKKNNKNKKNTANNSKAKSNKAMDKYYSFNNYNHNIIYDVKYI